ncbi:MAG: alkaline phosphatase D family protein [Oceanicaulis sp.]|uniref:alkaline phosphatase D family protein n=1 Tax=Glycocaulis sp. TaxID=1969725 RepID=UPI0025BD10A9|nr:alkaline phosphatase D family protein [Glycocaulis sp.]MCC5980474.1 alkaline phosphatase D family protein [Oceanicaulis sp.]MCH8521543.1 alkaline phosphatase D family protein [Glycocaulis sp.]
MFKPFTLTRRGALLAAAGAGAGLAACSEEVRFDPLPLPDGPFKHGVASGDPDQTSLVVWTAVTAEGDARTTLDIATEETFNTIVETRDLAPRDGVIAVNGARPMKALIEGLEPGREYFYRFHHGGEVSPVGKTRTLPDGPVDRFRIAAFSCSNYPFGFFNAYRDAANEGFDLMVHLGDYIYEYGHGGYGTEDAERLSRVPDPMHETLSEEDYARRHALYCSDPDLQAAKAAAPWILIWDDHETANDSWRYGAENHDPETEGDWFTRRDNALRAYHDWLPVREAEPLKKRYGAVEIGDLATLVFLETRLTARSEELTLDSFPIDPASDPEDPENRAAVQRWRDEVIGDPERRLLSEDQRAFVGGALAASVQAGKPWRIIANQVLMGRLEAPNYMTQTPLWLRAYMRLRGGFVWEFAQRTAHDVPMNLDSWDGFPADRERFYQTAREAGADFVVITGDTHNTWVNDLHDGQGNRVGTEFGVTSVTSPSPFEAVNAPGVDFGKMAEDRNREILRNNAWDKGYTRLTLTRDELIAEQMILSTIKEREFAVRPDGVWRVRPANGGPVPQVEKIG